MRPFRYANSQVIVHWLAALVILFLLVTGTFVLDAIPNNDARKVLNLRIHAILGGLAGLLVVARILLHRRLPAPPREPGASAARVAQAALNLLVLVLVFSGGVLLLQSGAFEAVVGSGPLPRDFKEYVPRRIHGLVSRLAMGLIALHVIAALFHQLVLKDRLLGRMGFGRG